MSRDCRGIREFLIHHGLTQRHTEERMMQVAATYAILPSVHPLPKAIRRACAQDEAPEKESAKRRANCRCCGNGRGDLPLWHAALAQW
jgi:hypothetical protein